MEAVYKLKEVLKALDIPRDRFNDWLSRGYIEATIQEKRGKRVIKSYNTIDVYSIAFFKHLVEILSVQRDYAKVLTAYCKKELRLQALNQSVPHIDHMLLVFGFSGEKPERNIMTLSSHEPGYVLEINNAKIGYFDVDGKYTRLKREGKWIGENWRYIHLINLKQLRMEIDQALMSV